MEHFDLIVIGSGPAGQKGAVQAAKLGKKVLVIDKDPFLGGACLNSATIPSKSLREAILDLSRYNERTFGEASLLHDVTIDALNSRLKVVIEGERAILSHHLRKNKIIFLHGAARFVSDHEIEVAGEIVSGSVILIASGSSPRNPSHVPFDDSVILDSTRLLTIHEIPKTMLVLGGGIIGAEYASFFTVLGTKVTVLDKKERLLPLLDTEIATHLQMGLKENGLVFVPSKNPSKIERIGNKAKVICDDNSTFEADALLYALGRQANIGPLGIDSIGIEIDSGGYIKVNPYFQTNISHIYAAGDVIGYPALASTSMEQGRLAMRHAFGATTHLFPSFFPIGIYTIPEISCCGYTEEELQKKSVPYEVGRAYYYEIAKSHITGSQSFGLFKILFHRQTQDILGIHIVGRNATEVIHIGQVAMLLGAKIDFFIDQIFNYPTFAEGYRIAAINGLNKLK